MKPPKDSPWKFRTSWNSTPVYVMDHLVDTVKAVEKFAHNPKCLKHIIDDILYDFLHRSANAGSVMYTIGDFSTKYGCSVAIEVRSTHFWFDYQ